jgi:hypothetical protein
MQYVRKNIQLLPDQAEELRLLAFETRESESEHIRRALGNYLKNIEGGKVKMKYIANLKDNGTDCIRTGYEETLEGTREECMRDYLYHIRINCGMEEITEADVDLQEVE